MDDWIHKFKCPKCENTTIDEIARYVALRLSVSSVEKMSPSYHHFELEENDELDKIIEHFECQRCGQIILDCEGKDIDSYYDLKDWIEDGCSLPETKPDIFKGIDMLIKDHNANLIEYLA
jgi:predicted RNA-binding Zn-ribbon protein involved in translation (DUF1610 family)